MICIRKKRDVRLTRKQQRIIKQIQLINYHKMTDLPPTRGVSNPQLFQKKNNLFLDINCRTETNKYPDKPENTSQLHKNGSHPHSGPPPPFPEPHDTFSQPPIIDQHLIHLRRQIESLKNYDQPEAKQTLEAELFVLRKRRSNLFPGSKQTVHDNKEDRCVILDRFINRKKPATKNSLKIKKFLSSFISKGSEEIKLNSFLQFISLKHKIPLLTIVKTPKLQPGYKESDIRKAHKYQVNTASLPPMGLVFDGENKELPEEEEADIRKPLVNVQILNEEEDCFDERPTIEGYIVPQKDISFSLGENKRQIFKMSRTMTRLKQQKEANLKRLAYHSVREVQKRYIKCVRNQNDYVNRAKKLHRQCLMYWRKREKQLVELKKKKEKLEAELKKRDEEEQEARKQEKRLQYIMYQSGLYSHFMATKLGMDAEHKKQIDKLQPIDKQKLDIDEEAARLSVNQIINSKQENLQRFDKKKEGKLDLSSVDQGRLQLVGTPSSFHGTLKEYQIKGLRWLNNLFQQGINGILADEMGLGKTIQAIALLSHISEAKNIWGPFLVVAPNSTLFNWQQEFKKFCPSLRVLPYWGNIKQRKTIRKFFSSKKFTERPDSPFHVVITSYQLTVADEKTFKRLKWQFMILDEAQAIKNILSQRWNILKEFQSRNRLLLTGTPIQNNMAELWALLNFVMPDLFDSHELFNEWFSKDIEAHSQDQKELDQIKIQRLHAILKPFMLRRIKKDVQHEIGKKHEHQRLCQMTKRQKLLYQSIKEKLNIKELFKMFESKAKVENLMNLVMQLRKVCNHPELFERRPARSPFSFQEQYYYTGYIPIRAGDIKLLSSSHRNPIYFGYPVLIHDEMVRFNESRSQTAKRLVNIYSVSNQRNNQTFASVWMTSLTMSEVEFCFREDQLLTAILLTHWWKRSNYSSSFSTQEKLHLNKWLREDVDYRFKLNNLNQVHSLQHAYMPKATAPCIQPTISSLSFYENHQILSNNKFQKFMFEGKYQQNFKQWQELKEWPGIINKCASLTYIQVIDFGSLIADSSKLKELDQILKQKKKNGDKVLIFCQMTKMIDILEDFMNMRKYTFFRLDGASNIADRRDMVNDFQKPSSKVFVFLLSTRAGGLGVTLTAANTVIFYDNDWNPTMDAQATDRAHRIGQSRDVNVYQLVTKGTIEERIVKRAQQKKTVQSTVYEGASFNFFKKDMIMELMVDQFNGGEGVLDEKAQRVRREGQGRKKGAKGKGGKQDKEQKATKGQQKGEDMKKIMERLQQDEKQE